MSLIQRLILSVVPAAWGAAMERESRQWMLQCQACQHEVSIWDLGGIRYRAYGNSRKFLRCPACGRRTWQKLYKRAESAAL
jgi:rRNA maturation endonuclease Nob1